MGGLFILEGQETKIKTGKPNKYYEKSPKSLLNQGFHPFFFNKTLVLISKRINLRHQFFNLKTLK